MQRILDLGIAVVVVVAIALPARGMDVRPAAKGTEAEQFALALAEARTVAHPEDGAAIWTAFVHAYLLIDIGAAQPRRRTTP